MIFIKFLIFKILIKFVYTQIRNKNITTETQLDSPVSSLTGAFRPAEIETSFNITAENPFCKSSFAKYVVSIRKFENDNKFGRSHFCGGVIIQANLILTAAHCLTSNEKIVHPSSLRVVAKTPTRLLKTPETEILRVQKIIVHKLFSESGHENDIGLLRLKKNIKLDMNCASVITLPEQRISDSNNCIVLGWGKLYLKGPMANEILQLNVTLHSKAFCEMFLMENEKFKICASDRRDFEKNPCSGDSGGPLICEGILTGLVSYGFQCGLGLPTIYTDVYEYMRWIRKNNADQLIFVYAICVSVLLNVISFLKYF